MLNAADVGKFTLAANILENLAATTGLRTGNFAVAAAVMLHGAHRKNNGSSSTIPDLVFAPGEGAPVTTGVLQTAVCDRTWTKAAAYLPVDAEGPVYKPFTGSFKPTSSSVNNNWRNSFDLQAGLSCDAPYNMQFLRDPEYIATPRFNCPYRVPTTGVCSSPDGLVLAQRTCFNPSKHPQPPTSDTRAAMTPKLLTRVRVGSSAGYHLIQPTLGSLTGLLKDPTQRVPALVFAMALYGGSDYFMSINTAVSVERLQSDLGLSDAQFVALFDPDLASGRNWDLLNSTSTTTAAPATAATDGGPTSPSMAGPGGIFDFDPGITAPTYQAKLGSTSDPAERARLQEKANIGHNRALRSLGVYLGTKGFHQLTEQVGGYDLSAKKAAADFLFEIKTWTDINIRTQLRHGIIQLYEYRFFNGMPVDTKMVLVLDRRPPTWIPNEMWQFIREDRGVIPAWMEKDELTTFPDFTHELT